MKSVKIHIIALLCGVVVTASAQLPPPIIHYQGRVAAGGTNFTGNGLFKFALVSSNGSISFWSNDGSSAAGSQPTASVTLPTTNGLYAVLLGDTALAGMTLAIPSTTFSNADVRLRIWFSNGSGFQQLAPDQRIAAVGYALMAANVPDGVITSNKLADGAVTSVKLANNAVTAGKIAGGAIVSSNLATSIALGTTNVNGQLDVYRTAAGTPGVSLFGNGSQISTYGSDGLEQIRLWGPSWGEIMLNDSSTNNRLAAFLSANGSAGGLLSLYQRDGQIGARVLGDSSGSGRLDLFNTNGSTRVVLFGQSAAGTGGEISVGASNGTETVEILGQADSLTGGKITLRQDNGTIGAMLIAEFGSGEGAAFELNHSVGGLGLRLEGDYFNGGRGTFYNASSNMTVDIQGDGDVGSGGYLRLLNASGSTRLTLIGQGSGGGAEMRLANTNASTRLSLFGQGANGAGEVNVFDTSGTETIEILGQQSATLGSRITMRQSSGTASLILDGEFGAVGEGSAITLNNGAGSQRLRIEGDQNDAGYLVIYGTNGLANIILNGQSAGEGRITCDVLQINGGADLSEQFDIKSIHSPLKPGMIVCIDPENPGQLVTSSKAYDRTVAGIVSGAGGVKPGMLMGQTGTKADGKYPVALTGRVYCWVDADQGAIQPGDLITTSATPGHGMKVMSHDKAQGAVIGKAMSPLDKGRGLVLVLVSLQ